MGAICCLETSVNSYQDTLHNNPEDISDNMLLEDTKWLDMEIISDTSSNQLNLLNLINTAFQVSANNMASTNKAVHYLPRIRLCTQVI
jgi:hypothetical protein